MNMTMRYAHLSMEHLQNVMKGFNLGSSTHDQAPTREALENSVVFMNNKRKVEDFTQNSPKMDADGSSFLNLQREI